MSSRDEGFVKESFIFVGRNWKFFVCASALLALPLVNIVAFIILAGYMIDFIPTYIKNRRRKYDLPSFSFLDSFTNGVMLAVIGLVYLFAFSLAVLMYGVILLVIFGGLYVLSSLSIFYILGFLFFSAGLIVGSVLWTGLLSLSVAKYAMSRDISSALRIKEIYLESSNRRFWVLVTSFILYTFFMGVVLWFVTYFPSFIYTSSFDINNLSPLSVILEYILLNGLFGAYKLMLSFLVYGKLYLLRNKRV